MENLWIFYSLAGLVALWLGDFIKKLVLTKGGNKEVFLLSCFCLYLPILWANMLFQWTGEYDADFVKNALVLWLTDFCIPLWMLTTLKYLNVSFALVSIRLVSSFVILFIGTYLLWDQLSTANILWFMLGAVAIFLLSGFQMKNIGEMHKKWLIALLITTGTIIVSNSYFKYIVPDINVHDFMPLKFFVSFCCICLYIVIRKKHRRFNLQDFRMAFPYALLTSLIFTLHFLYFLPNIYLLWPLSLSYKILSYSLMVPILLSLLFLGEKMDRKKFIAFALTIISIALFL